MSSAPEEDGPDDGYSLLFVYGTLRSGGGKEGMLLGCRWMEDAAVDGALYDFGAHPALVVGEPGRVEGELWLCPRETLARLDAYEGVGEGLFVRAKIPLEDGWCWSYAAGPLLLARLEDATLIPSGRWDPNS
jgi:gamma-glutamylaminecyclotransferase